MRLVDVSDLLKGLSSRAEQLSGMTAGERAARFKKARKGRPKKK